MANGLVKVDDENFEALVSGSKVPFVLELSAVWCGPCRALAPVLEKLAAEGEGKFQVGVLDVDDAPRAAERLRARGIPTVIAFAPGGVEHARHTGTTSLERLRALVP